MARSYDNIIPPPPGGGRYPVSDKFGVRPVHPVTGEKGKPHNGVDIAVPVGTPVSVPRDGQIVWVQKTDKGGYGLYVVVAHPSAENPESYTLSAHLDKNKFFRENDFVKANDVIGLSGNTGDSTGPHLHYEERRPRYDDDGNLLGGKEGIAWFRAEPLNPASDPFGYSQPVISIEDANSPDAWSPGDQPVTQGPLTDALNDAGDWLGDKLRAAGEGVLDTAFPAAQADLPAPRAQAGDVPPAADYAITPTDATSSDARSSEDAAGTAEDSDAPAPPPSEETLYVDNDFPQASGSFISGADTSDADIDRAQAVSADQNNPTLQGLYAAARLTADIQGGDVVGALADAVRLGVSFTRYLDRTGSDDTLFNSGFNFEPGRGALVANGVEWGAASAASANLSVQAQRVEECGDWGHVVE
jgi:hypothetical protein